MNALVNQYLFKIICLIALILLTESPLIAEPLLAFPGAEGFGAYAQGGRGGRVIHVTNLRDNGPGSLRDAVEQEGPRTVVFDLSGTIVLEQRLQIQNPYITIAGQTAPGDGICLRNGSLVIDTSEVIVRYLRCRLGDLGDEGDSISVTKGENIIVDHCSASWCTDEALSVSTSEPTLTNVTVQWCFITEALNPKDHSYGSLIRGTGGARYSYHHNLYAHNRGRNPRPGNYDSNPHDQDPDGLLLDFRNNVIYNWRGNYAGYNADELSVTHLNYVGNFLVPGPSSSNNNTAYRTGSPYNRGYFAGNQYNYRSFNNQWILVQFDSGWTAGQIEAYKQTQPFEKGPIAEEDAQSAFERILAQGGASLPVRDSVDERIIEDVQNRTGKIIDGQSEVGGWPQLSSQLAPSDADQDGMPDAWEQHNGFDPQDSEDRNLDQDGNGYTNLEEYLNELVAVGSNPTESGYPDAYWTMME